MTSTVPRNPETDQAQLTPREQEIVTLAAKGLSNKYIAEVLGIGIQTVKNILHSSAAKLGVSGRMRLGLRAIKFGWVSEEDFMMERVDVDRSISRRRATFKIPETLNVSEMFRPAAEAFAEKVERDLLELYSRYINMEENTTMLPTGLYRHYKGGTYLILGIAQHTEKDEKLVVYVSLHAELQGLRLRARPLAMFTEQVDGRPRFEYIGHEAHVKG